MGITKMVKKIALIGAGYTAQEHAKAFVDIEDVQLVGVFSRTRQRAEALAQTYGIAGVYDSIDALYHQTHADAVIVTVNEPAMLETCLACLHYDWTLLVEKPPGLYVAQAETLLQEAVAHQREVYVALNRRFYHSTQTALNDLNSITSPRYIVIQDQQDREAARARGRTDEVLRYWMYANAIHMVDYLRIFGRGNITQVTPVFAWSEEAHPRVVTVALTFDSGDKALYESLWEAPAPWAVSITTPVRRWELRPVEDVTRQEAGTYQRVPIERSDWDTRFKPGYRAQAQAFVDHLRGLSSQSVPLAEALETMRLVQTIYGR